VYAEELYDSKKTGREGEGGMKKGRQVKKKKRSRQKRKDTEHLTASGTLW